MLTVKYREMLAIACEEKSYGEFSFFFRIGRMGLVCNALRICFSNRSREVWFWVAMCSILPNWLFGLCFLENRTFVVLVLGLDVRLSVSAEIAGLSAHF